MARDLYLFSVKGSGAELFVKWLTEHLDQYEYLHARITPDGRVVSGEQLSNYTGEGDCTQITLIQDQELGQPPGERLVLVNSPMVTFGTRASLGPSHNIDPHVVKVWKELANQEHAVNLEQFVGSAQYRTHLAKKLGLREQDESRAPFLDLNNQRYGFNDTIPSDIAWVFDTEVRELNKQFARALKVPAATSRNPLSFFVEGNRAYAEGDFDHALACYRKSLPSEATDRNLALALRATRQFAEAEEIYKRTMWDVPAMRYDYFGFLQSQGRFAESWQHHEARWESNEASHDLLKALAKVIKHPGERHQMGWKDRRAKPYTDLTGKRLLVFAEGGAGDQLQYFRWVKRIQEVKQCHVTWACADNMVGFFKEVGIADEVINKGEAETSKHWDVWLPSMSAPLWLGEVHDIPDPSLKFEPKIDLPEGFKVGIAYQGALVHLEDDFRSMNPALLEPLTEIPGVTLVNLQHDRQPPFECVSPEMKNFHALAAVINSCDVVVAVDSAPAHMAGVLGRPCYLMTSYKPEYRWGIEGETTPWYPTHTLIRQPKMHDWASVVEEVREQTVDRLELLRIHQRND
ncbi:MAG TPA: tetratricopeptide repeat-containing glycosyltransferase family protein [Planctomycetaceae bacterium]|jgi:tetratricopeptide (TPR) repeat protein|nr:tetratricopeptide repeat-containing glycosyltransferase family protein [Planctomycetaceae bacterium]